MRPLKKEKTAFFIPTLTHPTLKQFIFVLLFINKVMEEDEWDIFERKVVDNTLHCSEHRQ